METKNHVRLWLVLFFLSLFITPLLRQGSSLELFVQQEVQATRAAFGDTIGDWIVGAADKVFNGGPVGTGVVVAKSGMSTPDERRYVAERMGKGAQLMQYMKDRYLGRIVLAGYVASLRLLMLLVWFGMLAPVLIAAVIDGFMQRALKRYTFGEIRPATYSVMAMVVVPFVFAPLFYLTAPLHIAPTVVPMWVGLGCLPLSLLIANTQRLFGQS